MLRKKIPHQGILIFACSAQQKNKPDFDFIFAFGDCWSDFVEHSVLKMCKKGEKLVLYRKIPPAGQPTKKKSLSSPFSCCFICHFFLLHCIICCNFFFRFEKFASLLIAKLVHQMEKKVNGKGEKIGYKSTLKSLCRRFQKAFSFDKNETSILKNTYIWCFFLKKIKSSRQTRAHT